MAVHVSDRINQIGTLGPAVSFEFFPPKTELGEEKLWFALDQLAELQPDFVSVTYGAGGTTRDRTVAITNRIAHETELTPVGHLTCVDATVIQLREVIAEFAAAGVTNLLALRGDPEGGPASPWTATSGGLNFASELVQLIRAQGDFCVGVAAAPAGHPASEGIDQDVQVILAKQQAGAEFALTQFFFEAATYFDFVDKCESAGVTIPVVPGIMPVTNLAQIQRFAELSGTPFPAQVANQFDGLIGEGVLAKGIELATELCRTLVDGGAPGLHFYTLNRAEPTISIVQNLDVS